MPKTIPNLAAYGPFSVVPQLNPSNLTEQVFPLLVTTNPDPNAGAVVRTEQKPYTIPACGELAGSATALQMPSVACKMVRFKAAISNAGKVYIGGSGVTKPDGNTDATTGLELLPGEDSGWIPVDNLNRLYRICDNAGDDLTYLAMVS